jgi:hypothetical protein
MMDHPFVFQMQRGGTPGKIYPITAAEMFMGRDITNDIVLNDAEVSRRHVRLLVQSDQYVLEDLGSTNGTFVNGERLSAPYDLHVGDVVQMGDNVQLVFQLRTVGGDQTIVKPAQAQAPAAPDEYAPAYAGKVAAGPYEEVGTPEDGTRQRTLMLAGCGSILVLACVIVPLAALWYIDANMLWCDVFPFLPGC